MRRLSMLGGTSPAASAMQPSDGACHDAAAGVGRRRLHSIAARIKQANSAVSQLTASSVEHATTGEVGAKRWKAVVAKVRKKSVVSTKMTSSSVEHAATGEVGAKRWKAVVAKVRKKSVVLTKITSVSRPLPNQADTTGAPAARRRLRGVVQKLGHANALVKHVGHRVRQQETKFINSSPMRAAKHEDVIVSSMYADSQQILAHQSSQRKGNTKASVSSSSHN